MEKDSHEADEDLKPLSGLHPFPLDGRPAVIVLPPAQEQVRLPDGPHGQLRVRVRIGGVWREYWESMRFDGFTAESYPAKSASVVDGRKKERLFSDG